MPADNFPESGSLARDIARIGLFTAAVAIIVFTAGPAGVFILGPSTVAKLSAAQLAFQTKIASTSVGAAVTGLAKTFPMTARAISLGTAATGRYIIGEMTTFAVGGFTGTVIMTTTALAGISAAVIHGEIHNAALLAALGSGAVVIAGAEAVAALGVTDVLVVFGPVAVGTAAAGIIITGFIVANTPSALDKIARLW